MVQRPKSFRVGIQIRRGGRPLTVLARLFLGTGLLATIAVVFLLFTLGLAIVVSTIVILAIVAGYRSAFVPTRHTEVRRAARWLSPGSARVLPEPDRPEGRPAQSDKETADRPLIDAGDGENRSRL
jgi:hypothetical protein